MSGKESLLVVGLGLAVFVNSLWWSSAIPFDEAPDEYAHIKIPQFYVAYHQLPVFLKDPGMAKSCRANGVDCGSSYSSLANYGYLVNALSMVFVPKSLAAEDYQRGRVGSAILAVVFVYLAYRVTGKLFPKDKMVFWGVLLVASTVPMFTFISSYINSDVAGLVSGMGVFWLCIKLLLDEEFNKKDLVLGGVAVGLLALSRANQYPVFLLVPWAMWLRKNKFGKSWKETVGEITLVGVVGLAVCGWWFVRNIVLYGEATGNTVLWKHWWSFSTREVPAHMGISPVELFIGRIYSKNWLITSFESFIGTFGYMAVWYPKWVYLLVGGVVGVAFAGLIRAVGEIRKMGGLIGYNILFWIGVGMMAVITVALSAWSSWVNEFQPQGRYLYAFYYPFVVFLVYGLIRLFRGKVWRVFSISFVIGFFLILNIWGRWLIIEALG